MELRIINLLKIENIKYFDIVVLCLWKIVKVCFREIGDKIKLEEGIIKEIVI